jgi:predicted CXXCH cytochrome family protein
MINHIIFIIVSLLAGGQRSAVSEGGTRQTCLECHGALLEMKHLHPQLETTCDICHTSTGEEHPGDGKAGFTLAEEVPGLCYACHTDYTGEEGAHAPAKEGYCLICHAVHGSDEKFLLTEKTADLCFGCHTEEGEEFRSSANTHHPVTDEMACNNCHDPHSSVMHPLLKDEANNLCLGCHEKTITRDTVTLTNIGRLLRRSKTVHLPVVQGAALCAMILTLPLTCHC